MPCSICVAASIIIPCWSTGRASAARCVTCQLRVVRHDSWRASVPSLVCVLCMLRLQTAVIPSRDDGKRNISFSCRRLQPIRCAVIPSLIRLSIAWNKRLTVRSGWKRGVTSAVCTLKPTPPPPVHMLGPSVRASVSVTQAASCCWHDVSCSVRGASTSIAAGYAACISGSSGRDTAIEAN